MILTVLLTYVRCEVINGNALQRRYGYEARNAEFIWPNPGRLLNELMRAADKTLGLLAVLSGSCNFLTVKKHHGGDRRAKV